VEAFAAVFYRPPASQTPADHAAMERQLQPAVDRFKAAPDEVTRTTFRDKISGYVKLYAFLSQIIPYTDRELEMLYSYGRYLIPHLPTDRDKDVVNLVDEVGLQYYRLQQAFSGAIMLGSGQAPFGVKSPTAVGSGKGKDEKLPLSEIIELLNERFGTTFTDEDRLFFEQIKEKATRSEQVIQLRQANPFDKFQLGLRKILEDLMIQRMGENDKIVTRYMDDKAFENAAFGILSRVIYDSIPLVGEVE
jgi:type I restriction enzyme R subunit